jgi:hypothetical protein
MSRWVRCHGGIPTNRCEQLCLKLIWVEKPRLGKFLVPKRTFGNLAALGSEASINFTLSGIKP